MALFTVAVATYFYPFRNGSPVQYTKVGTALPTWDIENTPYNDSDPGYYIKASWASKGDLTCYLYTGTMSARFPKSSGIGTPHANIRAKLKLPGSDGIYVGIKKGNGAENYANITLNSVSFAWYKTTHGNLKGAITTFDGSTSPQVALNGSLFSSTAEHHVIKMNISATVYFDRITPSIPTRFKLGGAICPTKWGNINGGATPTLTFYYQDTSNATRSAGYDETSKVQWAIGLGKDGDGLTGTVFSTIISVVASKNTYVSVPYPDVPEASQLDQSSVYYARVRVWDANENVCALCPATKITLQSQPAWTWWHPKWTKRFFIDFGSSHSTLGKGYTVSFPFESGVCKVVATNGYFEKGINHSGSDMLCRIRRNTRFGYLDRTYLAWRSGADPVQAHAYLTYYNHTTGSFCSFATIVCNVSVLDSHEYPSVCIDASGWIHYITNGHYGHIDYYKSDATYDISSFSFVDNIGSSYTTYGRLKYDKLNDRLYIFWRQDASATDAAEHNKMSFSYSDDHGVTWSSAKTIVYFPRADSFFDYPTIYIGGVAIDNTGRIHIVFTFHEYYGYNYGRAVGYAYSDNAGYEWYKLNGDICGTTGSNTDHCITYAKADKIAISPNVTSNMSNLEGPLYFTNSEGIKVTTTGTVLIYCAKQPVVYAHDVTYVQNNYHMNSPVEPILFIGKTSWGSYNFFKEHNIKFWTHHRGGPIQYYYDNFYRNNRIDVFGGTEQQGEKAAGEIVRFSSLDSGNNWSLTYLTKNSAWGIPQMSCVPSCFDTPELLFCRQKQIIYFDGSSSPSVFIPNGDDIRVVWGTKQIDRIPSNYWNQEETVINFSVQCTISQNDRVGILGSSATPYFLYYGNEFASATYPKDANKIYRFYEGFESYATFASRLDNTGFSNTLGSENVVIKYSSTIQNYCLNDLGNYDGRSSFYFDNLGSLIRTFPTFNEYCELEMALLWDYYGSGVTDTYRLAFINNSTYYKVKQRNSGIYRALHFNSNKHPATYYQMTTDLDRSTWYNLKYTISTQIKVQVNNIIQSPILTNWRTKTDIIGTLQLGIKETNGRMYIDYLIVKDWVPNPPECVPTLSLTRLYAGTYSFMNQAILAYINTYRMANLFSGEKYALEEMINDVKGKKTVIDEIMNRAFVNKIMIERVMNSFEGNKVLQEEMANIFEGKKQLLTEIMSAALTEKHLVSEIMNKMSGNKVVQDEIASMFEGNKYLIAEMVNRAFTGKIVLEEVMNTFVGNKILQEEVANIFAGKKYLLNEFANILFTDKSVFYEVMNMFNGIKHSYYRMHNIMTGEKAALTEIMNRAFMEKNTYDEMMNVFAGKKNLQFDFANELAGRKYVQDNFANILEAEKVFLGGRYTNDAKTVRSLIYKFANDVTTNKHKYIEMSNIMQGLKHLDYRSAHLAFVAKDYLLRIMNEVIKNKKVLERFCSEVSTEKFVITEFANMILGDKTVQDYFCNEVIKEKNVLTEFVNMFYGEKDVQDEIANIVYGSKTVEDRLTSAAILDKWIVERFINNVLTNKVDLTSICNMVAGNKFLISRFVNQALTAKAGQEEFFNVFLGDKTLMYDIAMRFSGKKEVAKRFVNDTVVKDMLVYRVMNHILVSKYLSFRSIQVAKTNKQFLNRISSLANFIQSQVEKVIETTDLEKLKEDRINEMANFLAVKIVRMAELFYADKTKLDRTPEHLMLEKLFMDREFSQFIDFTAVKLAIFSQNLDFLKDFTKKISETLYFEATHDDIYTETINFIANQLKKFAEDMNLIADKMVKISNSAEFLEVTSDIYRFAENIYFKRLLSIRVEETVDLMALKVKKFSEYVNFLATDLMSFAQTVSLSKLKENRFSEYVSFSTIEQLVARYAEFTDFVSTNLLRLPEFIDFIKLVMPDFILADNFVLKGSTLSDITLKRSDIDNMELR